LKKAARRKMFVFDSPKVCFDPLNGRSSLHRLKSCCAKTHYGEPHRMRMGDEETYSIVEEEAD